MNEELKAELETLTAMHSTAELTIDDHSESSTVSVVYRSTLDQYTQIMVEFSCEYSFGVNCSICVSNAPSTKRILPSNLLRQIEERLGATYLDNLDCMPVYQCITYCNDELSNDECGAMLKTIKVVADDEDGESAAIQALNHYRQECKNIMKQRQAHEKAAVKTGDKGDKGDKGAGWNAISDTYPSLLNVIPNEHKVRQQLQARYHTQSLEIRFICNVSKIAKFMKGSAQYEVVYHGTDSGNDESIVQRGLVSGGTRGVPIANGSAYGRGVYCSPNVSTACSYARGSIFVCLVKAECCAHKDSNIYVVPDGLNILPIYLVHGLGSPCVGDQTLHSKKQVVFRPLFTFQGNAKKQNRKLQRKWSGLP